MRIQYVITRGILGGAMVHMISLLSGLRSEIESAVIMGEDGDHADMARQLGAHVTIVAELSPRLSPVRDVRALRAIRRSIREFAPDVVHAHSFKTGLLGRIAAHREGVPSVFTAHGWSCADEIPNPRRSIAWMAERAVGPLTGRVIVPAEVHRQLAIRRHLVSADKVVVVHYGIEDLPAPSRAPRTDQAITAVMVARFEQPKDQSSVVRAVARLGGKVRLQLVGEGPTLGAVEAEVRSLGVEEHVDFLGLRNDVPQILDDADVLVLASRWEGQGLTILEAMRSALPVVASDVGGVSGAVVDGETGILVPSDDFEALVAGLRRIGDDEQLRVRMGAAGRERFEQLFTLDSMLDETMALYRDLLDVRR